MAFLPANLTQGEAKKIALHRYAGRDAPVHPRKESPGEATTADDCWYGYWHPKGGARCVKARIRTGQLRPGEIAAGTFAGDMLEEDVLGMILGVYAQPSYHAKARAR